MRIKKDSKLANKSKVIISGIIGIIIGFSLGMLSFSSQTDTTGSNMSIPDISPPTTLTTNQPQTDNLDVGLLSSLTGDLSVHGIDIKIAAELATSDFNDYLEKLGYDWRLNLVIEDTQTDPIVALEKLQSLNSKGIKIVLGPPTSAEIRNIKSYVDSNNILLVSPSSTASSLAINDNIFRLISDDRKHSLVVAKFLHQNDIKAVIPMYRGDVWADGVYENVGKVFTELGGVYDEGIRYSPEATVFSTEVLILSNKVSELLQSYSSDEIAILLISFSEAVHIMNAANQYEELKKIHWMGSEGSSNDDLIAQDPISAKFSEEVLFITPQNRVAENSKYYHVRDRVMNITGSVPNIYAYSSYDSVWLVGQSVLQTGTRDASALVETLPEIGKHHSGSIGPIILNDAGDLAIFNYELWNIKDGKWELYGKYDINKDTFEIFD